MSLPQNRHQRKTNRLQKRSVAAQTRCSLITGVGRSAVAVVAVEGPDAMPLVMRCFQPVSQVALSPGQVRYGIWIGSSPDAVAAESVIVTPIDDENIEIHCHGGPAATDRIVADLHACGAVVSDPHHWHRETTPTLIREACEVLAHCSTTRTAAIAMDQFRGAMNDWGVKSLHQIATGDDCIETIRNQAEAILQLAPLGLHLTRTFRVVLVGPPNVGKSSLLNAIVGYDRSITFDAAGTTRDVLHAETVIDGWPVKLSDTAGIRDSLEPIEREGVLRAKCEAAQADLLVLVAEPGQIVTDDSPSSVFFSSALSSRIPVIRLLNKSDLLQCFEEHDDSETAGRVTDPNHMFGQFDLLTNALTGEGIPQLIAIIASRLAQIVPEPNSPVPINPRQVDALSEVVQAPTRQRLCDALHSLLRPELAAEET